MIHNKPPMMHNNKRITIPQITKIISFILAVDDGDESLVGGREVAVGDGDGLAPDYPD